MMGQSTLLNFFRPQIPREQIGALVQTPYAAPQNPLGSMSQVYQDGLAAATSKTAQAEIGFEISEPKEQARLPKVEPYPTPNPSLLIVPVTSESIPQLQRLTGNLLQVKYPASFYEEAVSLEPTSYLSRQIVYASGMDEFQRSVGWIRCRLEATPDSHLPEVQDASSDVMEGSEKVSTQIYIQALCVLAPYRGYGAATALLNAILSNKDVLRAWNVRGVYAHVWEESHDELQWYKKRGFKQMRFVDRYYRKLKPAGAWIVWLALEPYTNDSP